MVKLLKKLLVNRRVFVQVYLTIVLISIIPVIAGSILYYNYATQKLVADYVKNNKDLLLQTVTAVDLIVDNVFETSNQIYNDTVISGLLTTNQVTNQLERNSIINRLTQIKDSSRYIQTVSLFLEDSEQVFCTNYGFSDFSDFPDKGWTEEYFKSDKPLILIDHRFLPKSRYSDSSLYKVISLVKRLPLDRMGRKGALIINIDAEKVYSDIIRKFKFNVKSELLVLNKDEEVILSANESQLLNKTMEKNILDKLVKSPEDVLREGIDGSKYLFTSIPSAFLSWRFIWISSYDELHEVINSIKNVIIISSINLEIFILLAGLLIIHKAVKPLDQIMGTMIALQKPAYRILNPFRIISEYMKDIIESNRNLQKRLDNAIPVYKERLLYNLLTSAGYNSDDIRKRLTEFNIYFEGGYFYVLVIELLNLYDIMENNDDLNALRFGIEEMVGWEMSNAGISGYIANINDFRMAVIVNLSEQNSKIIVYGLCKQICKSINEKLSVELAIGVSGKGSEIAELNTLYYDSVESLKYSGANVSNQVIFIDEVRGHSVSFEKYSSEFQEKLSNHIIAGDEEKASEVLQEMFEMINSHEGVSSSSLQNFLLQLLSAVSTLAQRLNIDIYDECMNGQNLFELLVNIKTPKSAKRFFERLIKDICNETRKNRQNIEDYHLSKILRYIDIHYNEDLSMEKMSDEINISSSYIYKIMKDSLNKSFIEYLTEKRLEKACELLEHKMKVQDVAESVGYSSAKYFIKVFKKSKGYTPNRYRLLLNK